METARGRAQPLVWIVAMLVAAVLWGCGSPAVEGPGDEGAARGPDGTGPASSETTGSTEGATPAPDNNAGDSPGAGGSTGGDEPAGGGAPAGSGGGGAPSGGGGSGGGPPPPGGGGSGGGSAGSAGGTPGEDEYGWDLPFGDETVSINEDVLYRIIDRGACDEAQAYLDEYWNTLLGPRAVLLYQAAIHLCRGDVPAAADVFGLAGSAYGWAGVARPYLDCNVYQAAQSVFQQQPPSAFACPDGSAPGWPTEDTDARTDPRVSP